jgi:hypothetical protein
MKLPVYKTAENLSIGYAESLFALSNRFSNENHVEENMMGADAPIPPLR